jgi:predicted RNase H-like HicB family nuclease
VVECPALPGCVTQDRDREEALDSIKEAIKGWLWAEDQKALSKLPKEETAVVVAVPNLSNPTVLEQKHDARKFDATSQFQDRLDHI